MTNERFGWQVLALRLAVIICHARNMPEEKGLALVRDGRQARLNCPASWSLNHPRTLHLLHEEADTWSRQGPLKLVLKLA